MRSVVAAMTAYTLEARAAELKLNQNESPFDFPPELKRDVLARMIERPWNVYPDFESSALRNALANAYGFAPDEILVGNGSNELLAAAIGAFVGPGTPVVFPKPTFALYEKLVTIAGGLPIPIAFDPSTGLLPVDEIVRATPENAVVIVCSPNNPTGGILPPGGLQRILGTGAMVLLDRAYADFAEPSPRVIPSLRGIPRRLGRTLAGPAADWTASLSRRDPSQARDDTERVDDTAGRDGAPLPDRLVTFSTFSKAWGLAALRVGWLAASAATCREIRKVKLPYSLNAVSEAVACAALERPELRDRTVATVIEERGRLADAMQGLVTVFPSRANFLAFRPRGDAKELFEALYARGILIRDITAAVPGALRVSIGTPEQNDRFLAALKELA